MEDGIDYVENQTRRNNLPIDAVAEIAAENWADTEAVVRKSFTTALKLKRTLFALSVRTERDLTLPADRRPSILASRRTRTETAFCKQLARRNRVASS
ncbi:hypothetical protein NP493_950g02017 [Ridgeia piscesae]|uniref:Uncharacterized protein n=1 Tax=Ridgeia piscesae TaxID=27915 RepID=A0AAD9KJ50_RIDPI|nr:hypothetical protein NP493_950g02017 [Ridgeia piscesae]